MTRDVLAVRTLALVALTGCLAPPQESSEGVDPMSARHARTGRAGDHADRYAERARLSASGRFAAPRAPRTSAAIALAEDPDWAAALDIVSVVTEITRTGPDTAAAVRPGLGVIKPIRGDDFVLLSTGIANHGLPGSLPPEPGTDFGTQGTADGDEVVLTMKVVVPADANQLLFQYNFLSTEAPDFNTGPQNPFNDTFTVELEDDELGLRSFELASVNSSTFFLVSDSRAKGTGFDLFTGTPAGVDEDFPGGFPDAGLTDFRAFGAEVAANTTLTLRFIIKDIGDGILDSAVLIDAVQFSALRMLDPNTPTPEGSLLTEAGEIVQNVNDLASGGVPIRGVVADGATMVLLRVKLTADGTVDFKLLDDRAGAGAGQVGELTPLAGGLGAATVSIPSVTAGDGQRYAMAVYRAPANFNRGGEDALLERTVDLTAEYTPTPGAGTGFLTKASLQIRRPPVVLVRGLWSQTDDWFPDPTDPESGNNPDFIVNNPTFAIRHANYDYACDPSALVFKKALQAVCDGQEHPEFQIPCGPDGDAEQVTSISDATRGALDTLRDDGIAATKVDVVAHGTGGIRVRQHIDSGSYKNQRNLHLGDINRLITVNTPHLGSRMATQIAAGREASPQKERFVCVSRQGFTPIEPGDIDFIGEAALSLQAAEVPSHAIAGEGGALLNGDYKLDILPKLLTGGDVITKVAALLGLSDTMYDATFGTCDHDLFVDVASQLGGLEAPAITKIPLTDEVIDPEFGIFRDDPDSDYFRALRHPEANEKIRALLNAPVGSLEFAGFPASDDAAHCDPDAAGSRARERTAPSLATGSFRITSPAPGAIVTAGDLLDVSVVGEDGFVPARVLVFTSRAVLLNDTPPFTTTITVPRDAIGPVKLFAIGLDASNGIVISDDVFVNVVTAATLNTVRVITQDPILYGAGRRAGLFVVGDYSDDVRRNITAFAGTEYLTSDASIVTTSPDGTITAVGPGIATVVAKNGSRQDSITVTVKRNFQPKARAGGDALRVCVAPGETIPVQLDGSDSSDIDGDPLSYVWLEGGVEVATGATAVVEFAPGIHTLELVVSDGISSPAIDTVVITIAGDLEPPTLAVAGDNPKTTECGAAYSDDGATAHDACDGDLTAAVQSKVLVDPSTVGSYTVDYEVQDSVGLSAMASRSVSVADRTPPTLVVLGPSPATAECGLAYQDNGASASDLCDGDLTSAVKAESHVDAGTVGSYTVDYEVEDGAGLSAAASRSVTVADHTPPAIALLGNNPSTVECAARYRDPGATATDLCDGDLTGALSVVSRVNTRFPGTYTVDFQVRDASGLTAKAQREVVVADTAPPHVSIKRMRTLSSPDDHYRSFELSDCAEVFDACSGRLDIDRFGDIVAIHSDEPDRTSRHDPDDDIVISSHSRFKLREQANRRGNGRVYEIEFTVRDRRGNTGDRRSCFIGVNPRFHHGPPVNDGRIFTVRPRR